MEDEYLHWALRGAKGRMLARELRVLAFGHSFFAVFPGKVTLKKGLTKGTYKVKVAVTSKCKVSAAKPVTVTIKVK